MKKISIFALMLTGVLFSFTTLDTSTWIADKSHSKIGFSVVHLGISDVDGTFKKFDAKFNSSKEDFTDAVFEFTADVNSISTDDDSRDGHIKSPDFFDAAKFSSITFKSKSVKKVVDKKYIITGELTMHGMTKLVELEATISSAVNPVSKKSVVGVKINGKLNRSSFNIGSSIPGFMVSDEVAIKGSAEFGK